MSASITCPKCNKTSHSETDVKMRWCGSCECYHADMNLVPIQRFAFAERLDRVMADIEIVAAEHALVGAQKLGATPAQHVLELLVRFEAAALALTSRVPLALLEEVLATLKGARHEQPPAARPNTTQKPHEQEQIHDPANDTNPQNLRGG